MGRLLHTQQQLVSGEEEVLYLKHLEIVIPKIKKILIKTNLPCLKEVYNDLLNLYDIVSRYSSQVTSQEDLH